MSRDLSTLQAGQRGQVEQLRMPAEAARELLRLGFAPGTEIRCLRRCPLGGPTVLLLRGTVLALRSTDAKRILLAD